MSIEIVYPTSCTPAECYVYKKVATWVIIPQSCFREWPEFPVAVQYYEVS